MIEFFIVIWIFINVAVLASLFENHFEFGDKDNFDVRDKTLIELFAQYIILLPIVIICLVVMIFNWTPFKEK